MNKLLIFFCLATISSVSFSQTTLKLPEVDKSTMDISYYPNNYPILKIQNKVTEPLAMRVIYSRPVKQGRKVFGELVEYGKVWRLGANEATEIEFFRDVKINGKNIEKGRYTLYALINETSWTLIVNKDTDVWGAFKYDVKKDLVRIELPVENISVPVEAFSMIFEKSATGVNLVMAWDQVKVTLPFSL